MTMQTDKEIFERRKTHKKKKLIYMYMYCICMHMYKIKKAISYM